MRASEWRFLVAAMVLHLAVPVGAAIAPDRPVVPIDAARAPLPTEVDIDFEPREPEPPPVPSEALPEGEAAVADDEPLASRDEATAGEERPRRGARARRADRDDRERDDERAAVDDEILTAPEKGVGSFDIDPGRPPTSDIDRPPSAADIPGLGLGSPYGVLPPGVLPPGGGDGRTPAPTTAPRRTYDLEQAKKSVDAGVRGKDAKLGLDFPGASAIAAVLRDSVRSSATPDECHGSFSVTVNAGGKVTSVRLVSYAGGDSGTWQAVRNSAQATLAGRTFAMKSSFSKGAIVSVMVRSALKMPGGGASRNGATFSFDVADIGAKPVRVVTMSFSTTPVE